MEIICPRDKCTGCMACVNTCALKAIYTEEDSKGFLYPKIDQNLCKSCGKCIKICPQNTTPTLREPIKVYAMLAKEDALRSKSSSGGIFSLLARNILRQNGVIFGAAFNSQWRVSHCMAQTEDELSKLQTSKYVQSDIGFSYRDVKKSLNQNKKVLFVGTPCQIDGLYKYLGTDHVNLLTVDLMCHGVPSPGVFARWIDFEILQHGAIETISFREKNPGWKTYRVVIRFKNGEKVECKQNEGYMHGFLKNMYLRERCYQCPYACTSRAGDITLGDFWGYQESYPEYIEDDDKGISLVLANTSKGVATLNRIRSALGCAPRTIQDAMNGNPILRTPATRSPYYDAFWSDYPVLSWDELMTRYAPSKPELEDIIKPDCRNYYSIPYVKRHWKHKIRCFIRAIIRRF